MPDEALLEFLGEFKDYDEDTMAIAFEAPLDAPENENASRSETAHDKSGEYVYD